MIDLATLFPTIDQIPDNLKIEPLEQRHYLVNGQLRAWAGTTQDVFSPVYIKEKKEFNQIRIGSYPILGEAESMEALDAAVKAYDNGRGEWPTMSVAERIHCMEVFTLKMIEKRAEVVKLLAWEIGKSIPDSEKEFDRTVDYIRLTINELKEFDRQGSRFQIDQGIIGQIRRAPIGVVLCMGPFNYPLNETYATLIPALIMGNTILIKPPKYGTLLHYPLLEAFRDAFPKGVVNTIYGRGNNIIPSLMSSGKVDCLALIGSSRVADSLKKLHPKSNRLRAILGLDAKNMAVVLPDSDLALAVKETIMGALSFNGQRCTAIKIVYVHENIAGSFIQLINEEIAKLKLGMPWDKGVFITPLPEAHKPQYLKELVDDAVSKGSKIMNEGGGDMDKSFFYPAVLYPVNKEMRIFREEQFGPIIPIVPFKSIEEPIQYLIDSDHGQQVSIFGRDPEFIAQLVDPLVNQVCRVNINAQCQRSPDTFPFTGRKDSAEGTLSVHDALRSFSIRTMIATKYSDENKSIINQIVHNRKSKFISTDYIL